MHARLLATSILVTFDKSFASRYESKWLSPMGMALRVMSVVRSTLDSLLSRTAEEYLTVCLSSWGNSSS